MNRCTSQTVTPLSVLFFCFSPIESSIKVLRPQDKLQVATPSAMSPQSVGFILCIHLGKSPQERGKGKGRGNLEGDDHVQGGPIVLFTVN